MNLCLLTFAGHCLAQVWSRLRLDTSAGAHGVEPGNKESNKLLQMRN